MAASPEPFDELLALHEGSASAYEWRARLTAFREAYDTSPPPSFSKLHGEERKAQLISALTDRLLSKTPSEWDTQTCMGAVWALRVLSREQAADSGLRSRELLLYAADQAGLASGMPRGTWDSLSEQASVLLANLLVLHGESGAQMLRSELDAETSVASVLVELDSTPMPQLIAYANVAFRLSFLPKPQSADAAAVTERLFSRLVAGVEWAAAQASATQAEVAEPLLNFLDILVRGVFNHLRGALASGDSDPCGAADALAQALQKLLGSASLSDRLDRSIVTSLQLTMVMPKERTFGALAVSADRLPALLLPMLQQVESGDADSNTPVVTMLVLQKIAEVSHETARKLRRMTFVAEVVPQGSLGPDPNRKLDTNAPLEDHIFKLMCSSNMLLKKVAADMVYALCEENVQDFVALAGMGNAAGFLQERNLLAAMSALGGSG